MPIGQMSLFEFSSACEGHAQANGKKPRGGSIDDDRLAEMGIVGFD
jgi:hypothetical protein